MRRLVSSLSPLALALALAACSTAGAPAGSGETGSAPPAAASPAPAGDTGAAGEQARIATLERDARALARTTGCTGADACRTAPVGVRPCGGPRDFVVYCAASTDSAALFRKLAELEAAERAFNERSGMMSTCEMRMAPGVELVGGTCRAASARGAGANRVP